MSRLLEALHSGRVLLMDGAMGTELQKRGLKDGEPPELWNLTHPEEVRAVHRAYVEAGAEILVTNTFQANPVSLGRHKLHRRMRRIWHAAIDHARVVGGDRALVLASVGPCELSERQRKGMMECALSADGLLFETWSLLAYEITCLARHCRDESGRRPALVSIAFGEKGRDKRSPARSVASQSKRFPDALGANCGHEIDMWNLVQIARIYREHTKLPIFIRPNAGTPTRTASGWQYPRSPKYLADRLRQLLESGVTMVGGCCGTTPAHIAAFRKVIDEWNARKTERDASRSAPKTPRRG